MTPLAEHLAWRARRLAAEADPAGRLCLRCGCRLRWLAELCQACYDEQGNWAADMAARLAELADRADDEGEPGDGTEIRLAAVKAAILAQRWRRRGAERRVADSLRHRGAKEG